MAKTRTHGAARTRSYTLPSSFRGAPLGANLRCAIAHRGIHPTAIVAAQGIPGSRYRAPRNDEERASRQAAHPGMTKERLANAFE